MQRFSKFSGASVLAGAGVITLLTFAFAQGVDLNKACVSNARKVALGIGMYVQDYDETLPFTNNTPIFYAQLLPYVKDKSLFSCPETGLLYLPNAAISGLGLAMFAEPYTTETFRDAQPHKDTLSTVAFLDGHIERGGVTQYPDQTPPKGCIINMKHLGLATLLYAQDYDEMLPPMHTAAEFQEVTSFYLRNNLLYLCPETKQPYHPDPQLSYVPLAKILAPNKTKFLWDAERHTDKTFTAAFLDGHVSRNNPFDPLLDVDNNARADLLWQNQITGAVSYWTMEGEQRTSFGSITGPVPNEWQVVGTPDLDGNGSFDLLWQNQKTGQISFWIMDRFRQKDFGILPYAISAEWKVVGTPDLNGDQKPDLLFQNRRTGTLAYWLMDGTTRTSFGRITGSVPLAWNVVATFDLNGDDKPDILFQNRTTGKVSYWLMDGVTKTSVGTIPITFDPVWAVVGKTDVNRDGQYDIVFENQVTNQVTYWQMNGTTRTGSGTLAKDIPNAWHITGIR